MNKKSSFHHPVKNGERKGGKETRREAIYVYICKNNIFILLYFKKGGNFLKHQPVKSLSRNESLLHEHYKHVSLS